MPTEQELRAQLAAATARGDRRTEAAVRFTLAGALRQRGEYADARDEFLRAAELFRAAPSSKNLSATLNNLGLVCIALNDVAGARRAFDEAIDLSSRAGDFDAVRRALGNFAAAVSDAGDFESARMLHQQSLEIASNAHDVPGMARALSNIAWTELRLGSEDAVATSSRAVELGAGVNDPRVLGTVTHTHALVCLREGAYGISVDEAAWCRRTFSYLGDRDWVALSESTAAIAGAARGDWGGVAAALSNALATIPTAQLRRGVAQRCVGLASLAAPAGERLVALALCDLAISVADALADSALHEAAQAERDQHAASSRGTAVLRSCRAMFQQSGQAANLGAAAWILPSI